jgi:hypothetical protein
VFRYSTIVQLLHFRPADFSTVPDNVYYVSLVSWRAANAELLAVFDGTAIARSELFSKGWTVVCTFAYLIYRFKTGKLQIDLCRALWSPFHSNQPRCDLRRLQI